MASTSYNDGTAAVYNLYDSPVYGLPQTNTIGRRVSTSAEAYNGTHFSYDAMGRLQTQWDCIPSVYCRLVAQDYNPDGSVKRLTYPSGVYLDYAYNNAGRAQSAIGSTGITYFTNSTYWPHGALKTWAHNLSVNGPLSGNDSYNSRLQPTILSAATPANTLFSLSYDFHFGTDNNGNVRQIINNRANSRNWAYTYDELNRIKTAVTPGGVSDTFSFDAWGNMQVTGSENFQIAADPANKVIGWCYHAGNLVVRGYCGQTWEYQYDAENRLISAGGATYGYDAEARRMRKTIGPSGTLYWYSMDGEVLAESDLTGNMLREFVYLNGKRISRRDVASNGYYYYLSDHLGSSNVVVNSTGGIAEESDFYPFGVERPISGSLGNIYKFTGKERDAESGLDNFGARYDASTSGRFMTSDSASYSNRKNPQSWNLYAYALNNPVSLRDADGHKIDCANNIQQCQQDAAAATGNAEAATRVTTETKTHGWWIFKSTETSIKITGDINSFRALSSNASKLADLVTDSRTVTVSYDNLARQSGWDTGLPLNGGSTSYMNPFLAIIDPTRTAGAVYDPDAVAQHIPQANTAEEFGHEVLGHIWGAMFGAPAGTRANMRDSIAGENAVRALDPTRGQKGIESHHNYNEMPPDPPKPQ